MALCCQTQLHSMCKTLVCVGTAGQHPPHHLQHGLRPQPLASTEYLLHSTVLHRSNPLAVCSSHPCTPVPSPAAAALQDARLIGARWLRRQRHSGRGRRAGCQQQGCTGPGAAGGLLQGERPGPALHPEWGQPLWCVWRIHNNQLCCVWALNWLLQHTSSVGSLAASCAIASLLV